MYEAESQMDPICAQLRSNDGARVPEQPGIESRFRCPFPGCNRSFAELWRLKVHYRAPPEVRGSGKERGHGTELDVCPKCWSILKPGKHHVRCSSGKTTQRKRVRKSGREGGTSSSMQGFNSMGEFSAGQWIPQMPAWNRQHEFKTQPGKEIPQIPTWNQQSEFKTQPGPGIPQMPAWNQQSAFKAQPGQGLPQMPAWNQQSAFKTEPGPGLTNMPAWNQQAATQYHHGAGLMMGPHGSLNPFLTYTHPGATLAPSIAGAPLAQASHPPQPAAPHQTPPENEYLRHVFADVDEFSYVPSSKPHPSNNWSAPVPLATMAPPPGPPPTAAHESLLFNFNQFSHTMPRAPSGQDYHQVLDTMTMSECPRLNPAADGVVCEDDGDIMHLLFGVPDELPTMCTTHIHQRVSHSALEPSAFKAEPVESKTGFADGQPRNSSGNRETIHSAAEGTMDSNIANPVVGFDDGLPEMMPTFSHDERESAGTYTQMRKNIKSEGAQSNFGSNTKCAGSMPSLKSSEFVHEWGCLQNSIHGPLESSDWGILESGQSTFRQVPDVPSTTVSTDPDADTHALLSLADHSPCQSPSHSHSLMIPSMLGAEEAGIY